MKIVRLVSSVERKFMTYITIYIYQLHSDKNVYLQLVVLDMIKMFQSSQLQIVAEFILEAVQIRLSQRLQ